MGKLVTVVGGSGFLGRYVVQELLRGGTRVRIAARNTQTALFLKPLGGLGQVQIVSADVTRPDRLARAVEGSDAVINLVGILAGAFDKVQSEGAEALAKAAQAAGATAFVQVSAIGADASSEIAYARTKGEGENRVRAAFPAATIIRPSIIFGPEDGFVNRFAGLASLLPFVPVVAGKAQFQPVHVIDVAHAVAMAALDPAAFAGKSFEVGGPRIWTMAELVRYVVDQVRPGRTVVDIPDEIAGPLAGLTGWLPGAPITGDQWKMLQRPNVVAPGMEGLAAFGIQPTPLEATAPEWLVRYRRHGRFTGVQGSARA